jgi:hypothetical protein
MVSSSLLLLTLISLVDHGVSFHSPTVIPSSSRLSATSVSDTSAMMKDMRDQLNENDDARMVMDALRGKNLNDDDSAVQGLEMRLVDIGGIDDTDPKSGLPYEYDPIILQKFFKSRPLSILTRIFQLTSVGGGLALKLGLDSLFDRMKDNPDLEIQRAGELRDIITSLGPFYIKIGQALSVPMCYHLDRWLNYKNFVIRFLVTIRK